MKLVNFIKDKKIIVGLQTEKGILNVAEAANKYQLPISATMKEIIENNETELLAELEEKTNKDDTALILEAEIEYAPVVTNPEKIICIGFNYLKHIEEAEDIEIPKEPIVFSKFNNALAAHNEPIPLPEVGEEFDYEAELVAVIGKEAKDVSPEEALEYVFGYSVGNDLSVRDLQFLSGQWLIGKTTDKFAPVGPYLVTADEIDPQNLEISMKRNGKVVQSSNTSHMIFDVATMISYLSERMTLKPGDLIFTGTPDGVVLGYPEDEKDWLQKGDILEATVERVGTLTNKLV